MIVDFTMTNFRSIKDEQTFSLYVEKAGDHLPDNVCYPAGDKIGVLRSAGFYGANASGKSNVLLAFQALRDIIFDSGNLEEGDNIKPYQPYLLSEDNKSAPVRFEIELFVSNVRYRYCVAFTAHKIVEESLFFYPSSQQAMLFNRKAEDTWQTIRFGSLYKGGKKRLPFFANNAYLSKAHRSADTPQMIRNVSNDLLFATGFLNEYFLQYAWFEWLKDEKLAKKIVTFLVSVDSGISNIDIQQRTYKGYDGPLFSHTTESGGIELFEEHQESKGTQKLCDLAPLLITVLLEGNVLIIDELENSMHPFMAELIIKMFNDPRINKHNAQLIFSTHNISLMSPELLRRDQIWFTEKQQGATRFYSLDDFDKKKVKPQSPFNLWYAEGRFGAIPAINYQGIIDLFNEMDNENAKTEE